MSNPARKPSYLQTNKGGPQNRAVLRPINNGGQGHNMSKKKVDPNNQRKQVGNYIVGKAIGEGTFGKVKLGVHIPTGEKVAVKILEKAKIKDQADIRRVNREIKILKRVRHPNIIKLYEVLDTQNAIYLIMEICEGGEVFDYIVKHKHVKEPQACAFFHQIVEGLESLHKFEVTHRDLKPENLLLKASPDGWILKMVDFGLSNTHEGNRLLNTACGSPCYAAPEMIAGKPYEGPKADTWSLGVVLFALVCGYLPFEDQNTSQLYKKILSADYKPAKWISPLVRDLIRKILETNPEKRYTIAQIKQHKWYLQIPNEKVPTEVLPSDQANIRSEEVMGLIKESGGDIESAKAALKSELCNGDTAMYYLLEQKIRKRDLMKPKDSTAKPPPATVKSIDYQKEVQQKALPENIAPPNTNMNGGPITGVVGTNNTNGNETQNGNNDLPADARQRRQHESFIRKVEQQAARRMQQQQQQQVVQQHQQQRQQRPSQVPALDMNGVGLGAIPVTNNTFTSTTAREAGIANNSNKDTTSRQVQSARESSTNNNNVNLQTLAATGNITGTIPKINPVPVNKVPLKLPDESSSSTRPVLSIPDILGGGAIAEGNERPSSRRLRSRGGARTKAALEAPEMNVGKLISDTTPSDGTAPLTDRIIPVVAMSDGVEDLSAVNMNGFAKTVTGRTTTKPIVQNNIQPDIVKSPIPLTQVVKAKEPTNTTPAIVTPTAPSAPNAPIVSTAQIVAAPAAPKSSTVGGRAGRNVKATTATVNANANNTVPAPVTPSSTDKDNATAAAIARSAAEEAAANKEKQSSSIQM